MSQVDQFYLRQDEPNRSCFLGIRHLLKHAHPEIEESLKYGMPCFLWNKKIICYLWRDKKSNAPYILWNHGLQLSHPKLIQGDRAKMKVLMINPIEDIPISDITDILQEVFDIIGAQNSSL